MVDGEKENMDKHIELCTALNILPTIGEESWTNYCNVKKHITLEGDQKRWIGCSLYLACRKAKLMAGSSSTGNMINMSSLLRKSEISVREFFKNCKKWVEWAEMPSRFRLHIDQLERKFNVSMILFKKYRSIFSDMFVDKKIRSQGCSSKKLFDFGWILFVCLKSRVPDVADDLVNSFHVLLAVCDLLYANALIDNRRDLLNPSFAGIPADFDDINYSVPTDPPCIVDLLCKCHGAIPVEALFAKMYCMRPQLASLFEDAVLSGYNSRPETILLHQYFDMNMRGLNVVYTEYASNGGEFDERQFLAEDAGTEFGQTVVVPEREQTDQIRRDTTSGNIHRTPLSGIELLKDKERPCKSQTPLSSVTQSVKSLISLIQKRSIGNPSEALLSIIREVSPDILKVILSRVEQLSQMVLNTLADEQANHPDTAPFSTRRLDFATTLYYRILENILAKEQTPDVKSLLERDIIHASLFACSFEIVMYSFNSHRPFPWLLETFNIVPYYFYRVIEIILRTEEGLSRQVIKHLITIEEQALDSLAWTSTSPIWGQIRDSDQPVPRCNEVSFSNQLLNENEMRREISELAPQQLIARPRLSERFTSPVSRVVRPGQSLLNTNNQSSYNHSITSSPHRARPSRTGSLALFFRKFYFLANKRMQDLCTRLDIIDVGLQRKIWTCFEYSIVNNTELMKDRHLDQILMCALYVMCRVLDTREQPTATQFADILKMYRNQPQAESSVYRKVLIRSRDELTQQAEERDSLIHFYNHIYMQKIQTHAREYVEQRAEGRAPLPLSPLPRIRAVAVTPPRKYGPRIFMNPMDLHCPSMGSFDEMDGTAILIHDSPAKDLADINSKITKPNISHSAVKRLLEGNEDSFPSKQSRTLYKKLSDVMKDRSKQ